MEIGFFVIAIALGLSSCLLILALVTFFYCSIRFKALVLWISACGSGMAAIALLFSIRYILVAEVSGEWVAACVAEVLLLLGNVRIFLLRSSPAPQQ